MKVTKPVEWLTVAQIERERNLAQSTIRKLIAEGVLPAYRIGSNVRIKRSDLEAAFVPVRPIPTAEITTEANRQARYRAARGMDK